MQHEIAGTFLIDGHVHCHPGFDTSSFIDSARANFDAAAARSGRTMAAAWLLLAEMPGHHWFDALRAGDLRPDGWHVETTDESCSLLLVSDDRPPLVVVAGRQIVSREGLEVLALGTTETFADGDDLRTTIEAVHAAGALPVLPWGFGKWWGRRAEVVRRCLETAEAPLFVGDNGGRPALLPPPDAFALAARRGFLVLPGTDPLPLPGESRKVARYGFVLAGSVERAHPAAGLRRLLMRAERQPETFGRLEGLGAFAAKQALMQWRKRSGAAAGEARGAS